MTYNEICMALAAAKIENNRGEASMLICHFCGINKAELLGRRDEDFDNAELCEAVKKRCAHYPLQYILGFWDFCHETYRVTEDTLIPRQDTEKLVVDLFENTLEIARENAERNGVGERLGFLACDVLKPEFMEELGKFDCILSNPPYIETKEIEFLAEELAFEPEAALDGGDDGLDFYRVIIGSYGKYLSDGGVMLLEIGCDQAKAVTAISHANGYKCEVYKDFGGNDRVAYLCKATVQ